MTFNRIFMIGLLAAAPAMAQPIIIPLEKQTGDAQGNAPVASAPPVAPPTASPSIPETSIARGTDTNSQEQAYQPEDKPVSQ